MKSQTNIDKLRYEFLPSSLEIIEKPASPLGKTLIWILFLFILITIVWSINGQIDTVAVARGKIIPAGNIKVLQSAETAIITGINVIEGQTVDYGEILIELDDTIAVSDYDAVESRLRIAEVEKVLLLAYQNSEDIDEISKTVDVLIDPLFIESLKKYSIVKSLNDIENKESYDLEVKQAEQAISMGYSELEQINKQIEIINSQLDQMKPLLEQGSMSKADYQMKLDEKSILVQNRIIQNESIEYYKDQKEVTEQKINVFTSNKDIEMYQEIILKDKEIMDLKQNLEIAKKRVELTKLKSPVAGLVQGIGNNTLGGVVTPAQPIMSIVPRDTPLVLEIMVLNRDIGFIVEGMIVEIKLDTFSYQKYGSVEGKVITISPDAIEKENMGYVYKVLVSFKQELIEVDDRQVLITPGMTATAEIKLKKRRIIEFFIPAIDYVKNSIKYR